MDDMDRAMEIFCDVQRGLPRQGPGLEQCTLEALSLCRDLPADPRVLDVGCGPGMQTLALAKALPSASITALDLMAEYLEQCRDSIDRAGFGARVSVVEEDMSAMPFEDGSFDLIWSEAAAYSIGFDQAVGSWRRLLAPGGCLAVSELVWLQPDPAEELRTFWSNEYPQMASIDEVAGRFEGLGYQLLGHFTLPDEAWWTDYYTPLEEKLPELKERYAGDELALQIIAGTAMEIEMRRSFGESFGYEFFVAQRSD